MIGCAGLAFRLILFDAVPTVANALPVILAEARAPLLLTRRVLFVALDGLMALVLNLFAFICALADVPSSKNMADPLKTRLHAAECRPPMQPDG